MVFHPLFLGVRQRSPLRSTSSGVWIFRGRGRSRPAQGWKAPPRSARGGDPARTQSAPRGWSVPSCTGPRVHRRGDDADHADVRFLQLKRLLPQEVFWARIVSAIRLKFRVRAPSSSEERAWTGWNVSLLARETTPWWSRFTGVVMSDETSNVPKKATTRMAAAAAKIRFRIDRCAAAKPSMESPREAIPRRRPAKEIGWCIR